MSPPLSDSATPVPGALAHGAVRARHIVFLYAVIYVTTSITGYRLAHNFDPDLRQALQMLASQTVAALLVVALALIVPELRKSLPILYSRGRAALQPMDLVVFITLMIAWAFGAHRFLLFFPLLQWRPDLFNFVGYYQHLPAVSATFILMELVARIVMAPVAEELLFRGYLLNLWRRRWGLWPGVALSSLVFGLAHLQFTVFATVAGVLLALVYLKFGSLWPGTLLHALFNLIASPFSLAPFVLQKSQAQIASLSSWIPEIMLTFAFFPLLLVFWRRFRPTP